MGTSGKEGAEMQLLEGRRRRGGGELMARETISYCKVAGAGGGGGRNRARNREERRGEICD